MKNNTFAVKKGILSINSKGSIDLQRQQPASALLGYRATATHNSPFQMAAPMKQALYQEEFARCSTKPDTWKQVAYHTDTIPSKLPNG